MNFFFNISPGDIIYDIESYPNVFTATFIHTVTREVWVFEISPRKNDLEIFCIFMDNCRENRNRWVGFNNLGYDYPVVHYIHQARHAGVDAEDIYNMSMSIIGSPWSERFQHIVWQSEWIVNQLDLYKIHHFDNKAKSCSLKVIEFNMKMQSVEDLPFTPGTLLTNDEIVVLLKYNKHDVIATHLFYNYTSEKIALRQTLTARYDEDMSNYSDIKIGEKILVNFLEMQGVSCYSYIDGKKKKRQTIRNSIDLKDVIFSYINFDNAEFDRILQRFKTTTIIETKDVLKDYIASIDGLQYVFGTGGMHVSVESEVIRSSDTHQIIDVDVKSYYPQLGINHRLYPAHFSEVFCEAYEQIHEKRKLHEKGTAENEAFKQALVGLYGNTNNKYSVFYDTQYTMSITINGQLLLCMLIEQLIKVPGLRMIQGNTDGITYLCPLVFMDHVRKVHKWWEGQTNLELEETLYKAIFIRDVNNYIAQKEDGKLKRIGVYAYENALENLGTRELPWHKNWSSRIVAKAAVASLVHGEDIREFIENHMDVYDFLLRTKVPRSSKLLWGDEEVSNTVRYYMSTGQKRLEKRMPPTGPEGTYKRASKLTDVFFDMVSAEVGDQWDERIHTKNKSTHTADRRIAIHSGWCVTLANNLKTVSFDDLNHEWYIKEAEKLVLLKDEYNGRTRENG